MKVAFINPFILAVRSVIDTMVHVPVSIGRPYVRRPKDQPNRCYRVSAVIKLSGAVTGQVALSLSESVALALSSGLAGSQHSELNNECLDALAEIASMIAGSAKKEFPGGLVSMSVPSLVPTAKVVFPKASPIVVIPFDTGVGRFAIDIALWAAEAAPAQAPGSPAKPVAA